MHGIRLVGTRPGIFRVHLEAALQVYVTVERTRFGEGASGGLFGGRNAAVWMRPVGRPAWDDLWDDLWQRSMPAPDAAARHTGAGVARRQAHHPAFAVYPQYTRFYPELALCHLSGVWLTEREEATDGNKLRNLDPRRLHPWRRRGKVEEGRIDHHRPRNEAPGSGYHW